ncbi:MAG: flagellar motor protein MotD [Gammaproteobacteria bacterium]|nr:MAG: flagellar motor protein MotD [Gammaproteobacteria bacterium]
MRHNLNKESENTDRWLVSYADFITLLFAFFVVMYSVSQVNEGKFKILSETLTDAFQQPERSLQPIQIGEVNKTDTETSGENTYPEPQDYMGEPATEETDESFQELRKDLTESLKELIDADLVKIHSNQDWLVVQVGSEMLFESGSDQLNNNARLFFRDITDNEEIKNSVHAIKIRGYTDNRPIVTSRFSSNWALSSARAVAVVQLFEQNGIAPNRMTVEGYGQHQPFETNDTPEGRSSNRLVELAFSRYPPARSKFERENVIQITNIAIETETNNAPARINLIRTADGTLIIRGVNNDASTDVSDDNTNDNTNDN